MTKIFFTDKQINVYNKVSSYNKNNTSKENCFGVSLALEKKPTSDDLALKSNENTKEEKYKTESEDYSCFGSKFDSKRKKFNAMGLFKARRSMHDILVETHTVLANYGKSHSEKFSELSDKYLEKCEKIFDKLWDFDDCSTAELIKNFCYFNELRNKNQEEFDLKMKETGSIEIATKLDSLREDVYFKTIKKIERLSGMINIDF
jgi:hypothetical protein